MITFAEFLATATDSEIDSFTSKTLTAMSKKSRGKSWGSAGTMSFAECRDLITSCSGDCFFTAATLLAPIAAGGEHSSNPAINLTWDRLDPSIGYIAGNVVACSLAFNKLKSCMSMQQLETALTAVQQYNSSAREKLNRQVQKIPQNCGSSE